MITIRIIFLGMFTVLCGTPAAEPDVPNTCVPHIRALSGDDSPSTTLRSSNPFISERVISHLPKAIARKRRVGVELEVGGIQMGPGNGGQQFLEGVAQKMGGRLEKGFFQMEDAPPSTIHRYTELKVGKASEMGKWRILQTGKKFTLQFDEEDVRSFSTEKQLHNYLKKRFGEDALKGSKLDSVFYFMKMKLGEKQEIMPFEYYPETSSVAFGEQYVEGLHSEAEALEWIQSWRGKESILAEGTQIRGTPLGDLAINNESIAELKEGVEFVTPPFQLGARESVFDLWDQLVENPHSLGVSNGWPTGIHVSVEVTEKNRAQVARRVILRWEEAREKIVRHFKPDPIRRYAPFDRTYYGPFPKPFVQALKALGDHPTEKQILDLYDQHFQGLSPEYFAKFTDINPLDLLRGKVPRLEFRLFNGEFKGDKTQARKYLRDAVEFTSSFVEWAATQPLP